MYNSRILQHRWVDGRKVKYVAKVPIGKGKYRYFYTNSEYRDYLAEKKSKKAINAPTAKKQESVFTTDQATHDSLVKPSKTPLKDKFKQSSVPASDMSSKHTDPENKVDDILDKIGDYSAGAKKILDLAGKVAKAFAGGYYGQNSILEQGAKAAIETYKNRPFKSLDDIPKKTSQMSADEDQQKVNPNYDPNDASYSMNCAYCSATWDLRRRGYDVEARAFTMTYDTDMAEIASWYGAREEDFKGFSLWDARVYNQQVEEYHEAMEEAMLAEGEGAYGNFVMYWAGGGGHSVVWSIENGELIIRDTQLGTVDKWDDYVAKRGDYISSYAYLRTDNRKLDPKILEVARKRRES